MMPPLTYVGKWGGSRPAAFPSESERQLLAPTRRRAAESGWITAVPLTGAVGCATSVPRYLAVHADGQATVILDGSVDPLHERYEGIQARSWPGFSHLHHSIRVGSFLPIIGDLKSRRLVWPVLPKMPIVDHLTSIRHDLKAFVFILVTGNFAYTADRSNSSINTPIVYLRH